MTTFTVQILVETILVIIGFILLTISIRTKPTMKRIVQFASTFLLGFAFIAAGVFNILHTASQI